MRIKMQIVQEAETTVIDCKVSPAMKSDGELSYECGKCGILLLENMNTEQITGITFKCGLCRKLNVIPPIN